MLSKQLQSPDIRIGVIAENMADLHTLRAVVMEAGLKVASTLEFSRWQQEDALQTEIDAWIVNLDVEKLEQDCPEKIDALIDAIPGVMILCEGGSPPVSVAAEHASWRRRLLDKIHNISGTLKLENHEGDIPTQVWVLVGSVGGPDAICRFFERLPPNLNIAFVYANHIQADFDQVLADALAKNSNYPAYVPRHGDVLLNNQIAIISPEFTTSIQANATLQISKEYWQGQYQPNLDHVVSNVAKHFGSVGGVIVFSGMCDDGAASCRIMKQNGGKVWVQQPSSCVSSAMPEAALATDCVDKTGTPEELANHLASWASQKKIVQAPYMNK